MATELPTLLFAAPADFEAWLEEHAGEPDGLWLKIAKKEAPEPSVTYAEALDLALCFGWIDSQKRGFDERPLPATVHAAPAARQVVADQPRQGRSADRRGKHRPAGLAEVEAAKADGRWEAAYEGQRTAKVPADLQRELDANPAAREFFAGLDGANRYAILYRLDKAKKPETRERRLHKFVAMLERGEKIHN